MMKNEVEALGHGLYALIWKEGGYSLAAVGSDAAGNRWFAATNWISGPSFKWDTVESARLIVSRGGSFSDKDAHNVRLAIVSEPTKHEDTMCERVTDEDLIKAEEMRRKIAQEGALQKAPEAEAMKHLALAVANLRAAASWLMDGERNREEIASAIEQALEVDNLMKAVAFNLAGRKNKYSNQHNS